MTEPELDDPSWFRTTSSPRGRITCRNLFKQLCCPLPSLKESGCCRTVAGVQGEWRCVHIWAQCKHPEKVYKRVRQDCQQEACPSAGPCEWGSEGDSWCHLNPVSFPVGRSELLQPWVPHTHRQRRQRLCSWLFTPWDTHHPRTALSLAARCDSQPRGEGRPRGALASSQLMGAPAGRREKSTLSGDEQTPVPALCSTPLLTRSGVCLVGVLSTY